MGSIAPNEKTVKIFKAIVVDAWKERYKKFDEANARINRDIQALEQERQKVFDYHRQGTYTDEELKTQKQIINERISQKRLLLQDNYMEEFNMEHALDYVFDFVRNASKIWLESDYVQRLELQKLIFEKPVPFNGENFGNPDLSLIYQLKETSHGEKSLLVASKRLLSNSLTRAHEFVPQITAWNREIRPILTMEPRPQTVVVTY